MELTYIDWGGVIEPDLDKYDSVVQKIHALCLENSSCEVIELRVDSERKTQSIIVDFADATFDIDNSVGICRVERFGITYCPKADFPWEVRALRQDFPVAIHQNSVEKGEPRSLCLYLGRWEAVERSWTPELFIERIFWWLRATAEGTIHKDDQPIEQVFFSSLYNILLPEGHFSSVTNSKKKLSFTPIKVEDAKATTLIGKYDNGNQASVLTLSVSLLLKPIENGPVEDYASTLGQLETILATRNSSVITSLKESIKGLVTGDGISKSENEFVLLSLGIPRVRNGEVEEVEVQGFMVNSSIAELGESLSVLFKDPAHPDKWYLEQPSPPEGNESWKDILILPVNVKCYPSREETRKHSGIDVDNDGPIGIIAGVGAIGSLVARIWGRECWGSWSYVDGDVVEAHNITRHISTRECIGYPKSEVVESLVKGVHLREEAQKGKFFVSSITADDQGLVDTIKAAEVVVDLTTTIYVPRVISLDDGFPRTVSAFITPTGMASVMLLEDRARNIRCSSLEAQYYRGILDSDWGASHLTGHAGHMLVGAGCRELTVTISDELIHLHAATLSRQIRQSLGDNAAKICVWEYQENGAITCHNVPVLPSNSVAVGPWKVIWDGDFIESIKGYRTEFLPSETGGILFGIVDQKDFTITLVKAHSAPENSESTPASFERAAYTSTAILDDCKEKTAGIVTYVGEWHSHPDGCSAAPSKSDVGQLIFLSASLQAEGSPALMVIVSDTSIGFYVEQYGGILTF